MKFNLSILTCCIGLSLSQAEDMQAGIDASKPKEWQVATNIENKNTNLVFNDPALALREYLWSTVATGAVGVLGFYTGKGIGSLLDEGHDKNRGSFSFRGPSFVRFSGGYFGGAAGMALGSAIGAYWAGAADEEDGSILITLLTGSMGAALAMPLSELIGVGAEANFAAYIPLLALPPLGAVLGFNYSRWIRDKKRDGMKIKYSSHGSVGVHAPRLSLKGNAVSWHETELHLHALNLSF